MIYDWLRKKNTHLSNVLNNEGNGKWKQRKID